MTALGWWFESLWRGAVAWAALTVLALTAWAAWVRLPERWRRALLDASAWPAKRAVLAWYRLPHVQRRLVRMYRAKDQPHLAVRAAKHRLRVLDELAGGRHRYSILTEYLEPLAREEP